MYIKNKQGLGELNPAVSYLIEKLLPHINIVVFSDTDIFDIPTLITRDFPALQGCKIFSNKTHPWIDKTKPETYTQLCSFIETDPSNCLLIDNQLDFRTAAEAVGITSFGITQDEIDRALLVIQQGAALPNPIK